MSTVFFDTTGQPIFAAFSIVDLCAGKKLGSTFPVPGTSAKWQVSSVKVNIATNGNFGANWLINLDVYAVGAGGSIGALIGNLVTGFPFLVPGFNANILVDFTPSITPVVVTGTDFWLLISDPTSSGVQVNFVQVGNNPYPAEFTANCAPAQNAPTNTPVIMFVAGDPVNAVNLGPSPPRAFNTINMPKLCCPRKNPRGIITFKCPVMKRGR